MKLKKLISGILAGSIILSGISAFAMSTWEFDSGMKKGINYFNRGMYYEARDEFQWFCDYNWGSMNSGQQKYALDYLGAAKQRAEQASSVSYNSSSTSYSSTSNNYCYHNYDDGTPFYMMVVNCNEWVSLRSEPSVNATRLAKVPLGAWVYTHGSFAHNTMGDNNTFVRVLYNGQWGWVLDNYLESFDC